MIATSSAARGLQHLGPWSRIGIYHPGPAFFYWSAPFFRLAGGQPWGLVLAASVGAAVCAAAIVWLVWRASGVVSAAVAAAVVLLGTVHLGAVGLAAPWNPTVLIMPTACGIVAVGVVIARRLVGAGVAAVLCGAVVAQSHLGTLPLGLAITAGGIVGLWFAQRRDASPVGRRWWAVLLLVAVLPWVPVAYDVVAGQDNARATAEYLVRGTIDGKPAAHKMGTSRSLSPGESLSELASVTFLAEPRTALWAGVDLPAGAAHRPSRRSLAAAVLCLALALWAARPRRRPHAGVEAIVARVALAGFAIVTFATLRIRHEYRPYLIASAAGVGLALWIAGALAVTTWMRSLAAGRARGPLLVRSGGVAVVVLVAMVTLPRFDHAIEDGAPLPHDPAAVARIRAAVPSGRVRFDVSGAWHPIPDVMVLTMELEDAGVTVSVRGRLDIHFGDAERDAPWTGTLLEVRRTGAKQPPGCKDVTTYGSLVICIRS